jgi:magnesium transporter
MITVYDVNDGRLLVRSEEGLIGDGTVWIDLLNPTEEEDKLIEQALAVDVPTRSEMREIEASNRFYTEDGTVYMTAIVLHGRSKGTPLSSIITFILAGKRLITVRFAEPRGIKLYAARAARAGNGCGRGSEVLIGLLEMLIERQADLIERVQDEVERLPPLIFEPDKTDQSARTRKLDDILRSVGKEGDVVARAQESAMSLQRTLLYASTTLRAMGEEKPLIKRIEAATQDITSLMESLRFLSSRITFLLDATLGVISNEQTKIIKLFSVVSVAMMPPTLIASIYGMNFKYMPELEWPFGYPVAILAMVLSALLPYIYFRRKGWL